MLRAQRGMHSYYSKQRKHTHTEKKNGIQFCGILFFCVFGIVCECGVVESTFHSLFGIKAEPRGERDNTEDKKSALCCRQNKPENHKVTHFEVKERERDEH